MACRGTYAVEGTHIFGEGAGRCKGRPGLGRSGRHRPKRPHAAYCIVMAVWKAGRDVTRST